MQLRSGKCFSLPVPVHVDIWPTPSDVTPVYYETNKAMNLHIFNLLSKRTDDNDKTLNRLICLETCELLLLNKHLSFMALRNVFIEKFTNLDEKITTFDKFAYIEKLENLYKVF